MTRWFQVLLFSLFSMIAAAWFLLHTDYVQHQLKEALGKSFFNATGMQIEIGKITLRYRNLAFDHLVLKDEKNLLLLKADHAYIQFSDLKAFLEKKVPECFVSIEKAVLYALPEFKKNEMTANLIPEIPIFTLAVDEMRVDEKLVLLPSWLTFSSLILKDLQLRSSSDALEVRGSAQFEGQAAEKPLSITIDFVQSQDQILNLVWQSPFANGKASFLISPEDFGINGTAVGSFENLSFLLPEVWNAPIEYKMIFSHEETQSVQAEFSAPTLKMNDLIVSDAVLKIFGKDLLNSPLAKIHFTGKKLDFKGFESQGIHFEAIFNPSLYPTLQGSLILTDGIYEVPNIGVSLKEIHARLDVLGPQLEITQITARDEKVGKITGSGFFLVDPIQQNPFALNLTLEQTLLVHLDEMQITCNGPLTFKGNSLEGSLAGQLEVSKALITVPDQSQTTYPTVDVSYINIPEEMPIQPIAAPAPNPWPFMLDIGFHVPKTLVIEGRDLSSKWKGDVAVKGMGNSPLYFGELKIIEGEYLFNGNPFILNQGSVLFDGDFEKKTAMYVIASKNLDKVKVDVIAKGPVKNPVISFRSNPPLPQREILSWILFNRGTAEISLFQGTQLSESILNLSSKQQGTDVLSKIRSTFKIDRLEFGHQSQSENQGVNVQVGKYISDNILISIIKSDVNKLAIEADLTDQVKLHAQIGDDSEGQLLLKWKKDY